MQKLKAKVVTLTDSKKTIVQYPTTVTNAIYDIESNRTLQAMLAEVCISVATIQERDRIPAKLRADRKLVRVQDDGTGKVQYYTWDALNSVWDRENLSLSVESIGDVPEVIRKSITWKNLDNT